MLATKTLKVTQPTQHQAMEVSNYGTSTFPTPSLILRDVASQKTRQSRGASWEMPAPPREVASYLAPSPSFCSWNHLLWRMQRMQLEHLEALKWPKMMTKKGRGEGGKPQNGIFRRQHKLISFLQNAGPWEAKEKYFNNHSPDRWPKRKLPWAGNRLSLSHWAFSNFKIKQEWMV